MEHALAALAGEHHRRARRRPQGAPGGAVGRAGQVVRERGLPRLLRRQRRHRAAQPARPPGAPGGRRPPDGAAASAGAARQARGRGRPRGPGDPAPPAGRGCHRALPGRRPAGRRRRGPYPGGHRGVGGLRVALGQPGYRPSPRDGPMRVCISAEGRIGLFGIGCCSSLRRSEFEDVDMPYQDARSMLKVRLYPESMLQGHVDEAPVVARHLAPGLLAVVARDLPETVEAVPREHAAAWGIPDDELFRLGYANVADQDQPQVQTRRLDPGFELTTLSGESFFTTTNALWPDRYLQVFSATGALVGVPHRHTVLLHPTRDSSALYAINLLLVSLERMFRQ